MIDYTSGVHPEFFWGDLVYEVNPLLLLFKSILSFRVQHILFLNMRMCFLNNFGNMLSLSNKIYTNKLVISKYLDCEILDRSRTEEEEPGDGANPRYDISVSLEKLAFHTELVQHIGPVEMITIKSSPRS